MAETNPNTQQQEQAQATPNYDDIFAKLDSILDKRADGLAKSALKDNGVEESEIADIVKAYREQKANKATEQENALATSQKRVAELEKELSERDVTATLSGVALNELNLDPKVAPYAMRLVDRSAILGADGKPDAAKAKAELEKVLEDVPALKASANGNKGFQAIGAKTGDGAGSGEDADKKLRSYFGLK